MKFTMLILSLLVAVLFYGPQAAEAGVRISHAQAILGAKSFPAVYRQVSARVLKVQRRVQRRIQRRRLPALRQGRRFPALRQGISRSQAVRRARGCANGGQPLRVEPSGAGYNVRVLQGNSLRVIRVGPNGRCR